MFKKGGANVSKNLKLLDDNQLGMLMEIAYSAKPKPQDKNLEYFSLYLRKEEQYGVTTFSELMNLSIDGYSTLDFYTLKTTQGLTAARKLDELAENLKDKIETARKNASQLAVRPGFSSSQYDVNKLMAPEIKRLQQVNSLSENFKEFYSKGERIRNQDLKRLLMFPEVLNELYDEVSATKQQVYKLRKFLKIYVRQYSERKLIGQGEIESAWFLAERWMNALNSDEYIRKFNMENVPLVVGANAEYICHSLLYLDYISKIKLRSIAIRRATEKSIDGKTVWIRWEGSSKYVMQWCAIVDNTDDEIGANQNLKSDIFFAELLRNRKLKGVPESKVKNNEKSLNWHGLTLEVDTGRSHYKRTDKYHKFQTSKPHFKILQELLQKDGKEVLYKRFNVLLDEEFKELKITNDKDKRSFVSKKIREIRNYFGINTKKNREDDIFEATGKGYKLIAPMNL